MTGALWSGVPGSSILVAVGIGIVAFVSTNVDDIFLLSAFFADPHLRARSVVVGQFAGIGALVATSALAALAAVAVPERWIALLGLVPLALGVRELWLLGRSGADDGDEAEASRLQDRERRLEGRLSRRLWR